MDVLFTYKMYKYWKQSRVHNYCNHCHNTFYQKNTDFNLQIKNCKCKIF